MVSPTYFLACRIFEDSGFHGRLRSVPEDEEGVDIEYLSKALHQSEMEARAEGNTQPVRRGKSTTIEHSAEIVFLRLSNPNDRGAKSIVTSYTPYPHLATRPLEQ